MGAHPLVSTKLSRWQILASDFPRDLHSSGQAMGQQSYDTRPVGHARARASAKPRPLARTSRTPKRRRVTSLSSTMRSHAFQSTIRWRASPNMKVQRRQGHATLGVARERLKRQRRLNTMFKFCGVIKMKAQPQLYKNGSPRWNLKMRIPKHRPAHFCSVAPNLPRFPLSQIKSSVDILTYVL